MKAAIANVRGILRSLSWRFWVIFGYVVIVAVFCLIWSWSLIGPLNNSALEEQKDSLTAVARAGAVSLEESTLDPETLASDLVENTDLRATIILDDGNVIGESEVSTSPETMENHLDRPEVQAALEGKVGSDVRTSSTTNERMIYVALPATYEGNGAVLRIGSALSSVNALADGVRTSSIALLIVGILIAAFVAWRSFKSAGKPVNHLERVRSDFVANASHELKTPVTGILLLSDGICQASDDGDLSTTQLFAGRLKSEATRLQQLVMNLLDLSRLENTPKSDTGLRTDMLFAVEESVESHRVVANKKGLTLDFIDETSEMDDCYVGCDSGDADLIIDNLLDNAVRYTEKGGVTAKLRNDDGMITLTVSDTGIGIAAKDRSRIFERFYRVDASRSREEGSTGLGLSLVRHAAERAGGTVEVTSEQGSGTTFTVKLPKTPR